MYALKSRQAAQFGLLEGEICWIGQWGALRIPFTPPCPTIHRCSPLFLPSLDCSGRLRPSYLAPLSELIISQRGSLALHRGQSAQAIFKTFQLIC